MIDLSQIEAHMEVVGADGIHVGMIDRVEDGRIKLANRDTGEDAAGSPKGAEAEQHHLTAERVDRVEGRRVFLNEPAAAAAAAEALSD